MKPRVERIALGVFLAGIAAIAGLFCLQFAPAQAEPYIAARTGLKCSSCHVNQTGGGKRTDFGVIYSQTQLPMRVVKTPKGGSAFDPHLSETVSLGANFRVAETFTFEYTNSEGETFPASNSTSFPEANLYVQMDVIDEFLLLYLDQTLAPSSSNREFFGLLTHGEKAPYIKIGRYLLPYGMRLLDNSAFVRSKTGFTYARSGTGIEVGWEPKRYSIVASVTDEQFSSVASIWFRRFQIGGSVAKNITRGDNAAAGPFAGANFGRFTLLGEVDYINADGIDQLATLAEVNYLLTQGFNVKVTYEFFDRNGDVPNEHDGQDRLTFGIEPFLAQMLQVRAFYRINEFIPQNGPENQDQAYVEFHVFF